MRFLNAIKHHAASMDASAPVGRWGLVTSADPASMTVKVSLQPEGVQTDWLPLASSMVGGGWGMLHLPRVGTPVFCLPDSGDADSYVVLGATWSASMHPPSGYQQDEWWLVHSSGSSIKLTHDGKLTLTDPSGTSLALGNNGTATLTGNLVVTGDISDQSGGRGTFAALRAAYAAHEHPGGTISGKTGTTDHTI